ncbi:hypothetical protein HYV50_02920 [Candidatus Pacearchaeota archaeon]|nr:hypothetical protein [Candidatus Pacearchaeota archaeon]
MFFGKKRDEKGLPDLPMPKTPFDRDLSMQREEVNSLPSFPDSPSHNRFSEAAIKDAVNAEEEVEDSENWKQGADDMEKKGKLVEVDDADERDLTETMEEPRRVPSRYSRGTVGGEADVFVRIDKFHSARRALHEVRSKLREIDETIKRIRDIRIREEQELAGWEKDLGNVKARMRDVTENIFEKIA